MNTFDFNYWHIKILYDLSGYIVAFLATWVFYSRILSKDELPNPFKTRQQKWEYYLYVIAGAMIGGMIVSTFDGAMIPGRNPE